MIQFDLGIFFLEGGGEKKTPTLFSGGLFGHVCGNFPGETPVFSQSISLALKGLRAPIAFRKSLAKAVASSKPDNWNQRDIQSSLGYLDTTKKT